MTARLLVHVVPRARRTEIAGRHGAAIKIRVAAPPVDGAANAELIRFVAARLGIPKGHITIERGGNARLKTVAISGLDTAAVAGRLLRTDD